MILILQISTRDRTTYADSVFYCASADYNTGAGGSGVPADLALAAMIEDDVVIPSEIRRARDGAGASQGSDEVTELTLRNWIAGSDEAADLRGKEIIGFEAKLWAVGEVDGVTYDLASPYKLREGIVAEGSHVSAMETKLKIQATPLPLAQNAYSEFRGYGPALLFPDALAARAVWESWNPTSGGTIMVRAFHSLEDWEAGGTQILATNGDHTLQITDSIPKITIGHASKDAIVTGAELERPEAYYWFRVTYTSSTKTVELHVEGVSYGTDAGGGALDATGSDWVFGSNQTENGSFFHGFAHDWRFFSAALGNETAAGYEDGPLDGDEDDLDAWLEGEAGSNVANLAASAAVDNGDGTVDIPATAHGFVAAQEVTIAGTANYNGTYVLESGTSTNALTITATFVSETFATDDTAIGLTILWDKAQANTSSPKDATIYGARRGSSLGGGMANPGTEVSVTLDTLGGTLKDWPIGAATHLFGYSVDTEVPLFLHCDPKRGVQKFTKLFEGGVQMTTLTRVSSMLALYALYAAGSISAGDAAVYPQMGLSMLGLRSEGSVAADVAGGGLGFKGGDFDGVDDYWTFGTSSNSLFNADYTVLATFDGAVQVGESRAIVGNLDAGLEDDGFIVFISRNASGQPILQADTRHAVNLARVQYAMEEVQIAAMIAMTEEFVVDGLNTDFTLKLYVNGILVGSDSGTVVTADIAASSRSLLVGANDSGVISGHFEGSICDVSVLTEAKSATWVEEKLLDDIMPRLGFGPAVELSGGLVGLPVEYHPWSAGEEVIIAGTTNYNGTETLHADTTDTQLVITASYVAEDFDRTPTVRDSSLAHHFPSRLPPAGSEVYPTSTVIDEVGSLNGTITGATWSGGVGPTIPRGVVAMLAKASGQPGRRMDFSGTTDWPLYAVEHSMKDRQLSYLALIDEIIISFDGWHRTEPDGVVTWGRVLAPEDQTADRVLIWETMGGGSDAQGQWKEEASLPLPQTIGVEFGHIGFTEQPGELLAGAGDSAESRDRNRWTQPNRVYTIRIPGADQLAPLPATIVQGMPPTASTPRGRGRQINPALATPRNAVKRQDRAIYSARWSTKDGAKDEAQRLAAFLRYRRMAVNGLPLDPLEWLYAGIKAGEYVSVYHPLAPGAVKAVTLDASAAVDKGDGLVGIPATAHGLENTSEQRIWISGSQFYDGGPFPLDPSTSANELVIRHRHEAETFDGSEDVHGYGFVAAVAYSVRRLPLRSEIEVDLREIRLS